MKQKVSNIVRIVVAIMSYVNMYLAYSGKDTIETNTYDVYLIISAIVCIAVFVYNTYTNFDVTAAGSLGTKITRALKAGAIASESVVALLEESEDVDNVGSETESEPVHFD
jgi:hypothetical protein